MNYRYAVATILLAACGGRIAPADLPPECVPDHWMPCHEETMNDGTGPDDHRKVCSDGEETWFLYPSGETWHVAGASDVRCHVGADGAVLYLGR